MMRYLYFILFLLFTSEATKAQVVDDNIYKMYVTQYASLLKSRGMDDQTIREMLSQYNKNKIESNADFAKVLKNLYPDNKGIGVVFFMYTNQTLHRIFFKPGSVIEEEKFEISKEQLLQLSNDLQNGLQLGNKTASRSPQLRGTVVKNNQPSKKVNLEATLKEFTRILIPKKFDESYKQLIIIPALNIGSLPFQLLKPYADNSYLIDKCSFTISPGIVDLIGARTIMLREMVSGGWRDGIYYDENNNANRNLNTYKPKNWNFKNPLFVSNPTYPTNLEYSFPDLPGAKKEISAVSQFSKSYLLFEGSKAVKDSILKYWDKADLIYFATHGIADSENPMENSYLVLSGSDAKLTAKNIMDLSKKRVHFPNTIILSACQTGLGKSLDAGIIGMARAFIVSGSRQVVMSLWNVDDEATAYLMGRFMYHLQQPSNFSPSEQLRLAMLETKTKYPNPLQWASFSVFGLSY
jgi:CHAT domain-containing protein